MHYDAETLPRLAAFFYAQALEERNHALMMVRFLLDQGLDPAIPGVEAPQMAFDDVVAPVALALDQERRVTQQINALAGLAREHQDYTSEQFMQWFIKEQIGGDRDDVRSAARRRARTRESAAGRGVPRARATR